MTLTHCLEVSVLHGDAEAIRQLASKVIVERGVEHGQVSFIPAQY
jgi:metal-responsive CopG/Arc/MetJ family transcriptional regulator